MEIKTKTIGPKAIHVLVETVYDTLNEGKGDHMMKWADVKDTYGMSKGPAYNFTKMVVQVIKTLEEEGYAITKTCDRNPRNFH